MSKKIELSRGMYALVDDADFDELSKFNWYASEKSRNVYAARRAKEGTRKMIYMHRQILNVKKGLVVDHINGNALDNRRENLRICTHAQNLMNQKPQIGKSSKYKGVSWDKRRNKWEAYIMLNDKKVSLGRFDIESDAARAYDKKASVAFGEFANTNKMLDLY